MAFFKKLLLLIILLAVGIGAVATWAFLRWADTPILQAAPTIEFTIKSGSNIRSASRQLRSAGIPLQPILFEALARVQGKASSLKAGSFELNSEETPRELLQKIVEGKFSLTSLGIIEGWSFKQMRSAVNAHPHIRHDSLTMSDRELMKAIGSEYGHPEGLFFPDTYRFAKNSSDIQVYQLAHQAMLSRLDEVWKRRAENLPYKSPYQALIMASIVEKETGQASERGMIASVFVNRLRVGMLLQTDPTVIYGMGEQFKGNIRKRDLTTDTPYNTYTRAGLPPTPIALPGLESLKAAVNPEPSNAYYFVARGNGTSQFSENLSDHNKAVNKYQR
ncbi:endolytic transglycosylase MltG [Undibacterium sp. LX40W]|uniref:Endolytic murein transglycosylase n=1 Tax=Undibacterium nitidum TaxID=2762298 RepID=A0A923HJ34_9BURK|nr:MULTISPECIES: endolytic transglycosylase MltG [Undibacterium]MBC3879987.1 endolytic transglycosylase MltG [Undibacterium nitidum]MBC3891277.1 endolytic transglycosylase MltG [Undibacterium sp. LX40W]